MSQKLSEELQFEKEASAGAGDGSIGLVKTGEYLRGQGDGAGIWEDDDERRFYENLVDLKDRVPGILLEDKKKNKDVEDQVGKKSEVEVEVVDTKVAVRRCCVWWRIRQAVKRNLQTCCGCGLCDHCG